MGNETHANLKFPTTMAEVGLTPKFQRSFRLWGTRVIGNAAGMLGGVLVSRAMGTGSPEERMLANLLVFPIGAFLLFANLVPITLHPALWRRVARWYRALPLAPAGAMFFLGNLLWWAAMMIGLSMGVRNYFMEGAQATVTFAAAVVRLQIVWTGLEVRSSFFGRRGRETMPDLRPQGLGPR